jgi:hypothetical protein
MSTLLPSFRRTLPRIAAATAVALVVGLTALPGADARAERGREATVERSSPHVAVQKQPRRRCSVTARGIPRCGTFVGAAVGLNAAPGPFERQVGRLGVRRSYFQAGQVESAVRMARGDLKAGRVPWMSFKFPYSWAEMARGRGDSWAAGLARRFSHLDGPVWLAFHHEPEHDGDIRLWTRAQERLAPIVRRNAPNVAYSIILMGYHQFYGEKQYHLGSLWPRTKIDILGFDLYNHYGVPGRSVAPANMRKLYFNRLQKWSQRTGVAWGVAELGWTDKMSRRNPKWLPRTYRQLRRTGGIAGSYFHANPPGTMADWMLDNAKRRRAFATSLDGSLRLVRR